MLPQIVLTPRAVRAAWFAWGLFLVAACVALVRQPDRRPANDAYARGAARWAAAEDLYVERGGGFIYLPQSALVYFPFSLLPRPAEHVLWRITTIGLFGLGIRSLCRMAEPSAGVSFFPLVSLLVLPKTWTCAMNGQAAPAMAGLSMLALAEIDRQNWWRAAGLLVAALALKPLSLVLVLLLGALFRPLVVPLFSALAAFAAAPFLTAGPAYVIEQYRGAIGMLRVAAERGLAHEWPQLFSLLSLAGLDLSEAWQTGLRVTAAVATLALCWRVARRGIVVTSEQTRKLQIANCKLQIENWPLPLAGELRTPNSELRTSLVFIYALATCYLLLFNPRTENNSYVLLSPVIGVLAAHAYVVERRAARAALLTAAAIALIAGHEICQLATPDAGFVWIGPLVTLLLSCGLLWRVLRESTGLAFGKVRTSQPKLHAAQRT